MHYQKPPASISDQISRLKSRGLTFGSETFALKCLSNVSYYRLRAYTYPFQDNQDCNHPFTVPVSFEDIMELYFFDRKLRGLVFDAMERIEIAFRTQVIHQWAINYGSHWQCNPALFRDHSMYNSLITSLQAEITRSKETFIDHYKNTYTCPIDPPAWMSLEVTSFSLLSRFFQSLKKGAEKRAVTKHFGLNKIELLENWLHCFSDVRNICAHHGRLWNRRLTTHIQFPTNPVYPFVLNQRVLPYKLYGVICCMEYLLKQINTDESFKEGLKTLLKTCPMRQEKEMGFPADWRNDPFWN